MCHDPLRCVLSCLLAYNHIPEALDADSKNYHAWAHRQVVVAAAGAWQQEMEYLEGLLQKDVRNNSAWNPRAFVVQVRVWVIGMHSSTLRSSTNC